MSRKHTLHNKELPNNSRLPLGARMCLQDTASRKLRKLRHPGHPCAASSADKEPSSSNSGAPEPQATTLTQGSKELPYPLSPKGKSICRPDWRTGSPARGQAWLLYKQVLHRGYGGGADDFQTMCVELPAETLKKLRPKIGKKTFLALESRLEDNTFIPLKARVANFQRKRFLEANGGMTLQEGHPDYKWYCRFCKACEGWY
ncbi:g12695 [Coccomyxa viridis]|uniref:G12695 protein n=1 Tax=Coccomyxa viridis TaxID=1274662 RepID=A0ABP1GB02_9CHLO